MIYKPLLIVSMLICVLIISDIRLTPAWSDEVVLGKDTKKLFPQELIDRYQGNLPQSGLATGELKGAGVITGGTKKVTKVEIVNVKPISGNNPFYQLDPINNSFKDGKFYPVAVDQLASYLSGNTGGNTKGGGGGGDVSSKTATINFTSEPTGQAQVYFEKNTNLGPTPASTNYTPTPYNYVWFSYKYNTSSVTGLTCEGNITNIIPGETINVNFKLPKGSVSSDNVNLQIDSNNNTKAYAKFDINSTAFTINGSSGQGSQSNAISVTVEISGGLTKRFYTAGSNWKFLNQFNDTPGNTILITSSSGTFDMQEISTGKKVKVNLYSSVLSSGSYITSGHVNITMSDILPTPCFETNHSYSIP